MKKTIIFGSFVIALSFIVSAVPALAQEGRPNRPVVTQFRANKATASPERREDRREDRREVGKVMRTASSSLDVACLKTAISKRETALASNWNTLNTAMTAAISARGTGLAAAFDKPAGKERRTALQTTRKAFKDSVKAARKTFVTSERTTHTTYRTEAKACGATGTDVAEAVSSEDSAQVVKAE